MRRQRLIPDLKRRLRRQQRRLLSPLTGAQSAALEASQLQLTLQYRSIATAGGPFPSLRDVGFRAYCDADEDGILLYVMALLGAGSRRLVDLGSAGVTASNSANLILHHGWTGLLVDGNPDSIRSGHEVYASLGILPPSLVSTWLTAENVNDVLAEHGMTGEIDLLSIDLDGNDYWLWRALDAVSPRVVVIEYQDILGPERSVTVPYDPDFRADRYAVNATANNYVGASLRALAKLGRGKGYRLIGCNRYGFNAFFVRDDLGEECLPEVAVEDCFSDRWNKYGMRERFPLVKDMPWQEV